MAGSLFRTKSIDQLRVDSGVTGESGGLKRTLGAFALVALGIGAIIGAGLFVRTAAAIAERAGPSVTLAFMVAATFGFIAAAAARVPALRAASRSPLTPPTSRLRPAESLHSRRA